MNNIAAKIVLTSVLATSSTAVLASDKWEKESMDAWLDGKAETTLLLNSNLNSFDINTDVENQVVTLTGSVNNDLEKSLAEELVSGLDGVKKVNNE
ncbi:BON domain-containing protein, partial [Vibrio sp. 378]